MRYRGRGEENHDARAQAGAADVISSKSAPELFLDGRVALWAGDCLEVLRQLEVCSADACVSDPPYHLTNNTGSRSPYSGQYTPIGKPKQPKGGFMGKKWDGGDIAFRVELWAEVFRILKPGAHLVAFSGTRTYHRMACAIEDAGFEIRDQIGWAYGSGFPKSHDVSKGIDKKRDDRKDILRVTTFVADAAEHAGKSRADIDAHMGTSDMAGWWTSRLLHRCQCPKWDQWLQLKSFIGFGDEMDAEVWRLNGRKGTPGNERQDREVTGPGGNNIYQPTQRVISPGTPVLDAAAQWNGWGTALKPAWEPIVLARKPLIGTVAQNVLQHGTGALNIDGCRVATDEDRRRNAAGGDNGLSGTSTFQIRERRADDQPLTAGRWPANIIHDGSEEVVAAFPESASGSGRRPEDAAAQTFSGVKCGPSGRGFAAYDDAGAGSAARFFYTAKADADDRIGSKHPTVKPVDLMQYLVRLVTPPGGLVLDPFAGTGTTGEAAWREGMRAVLIEREEEYQADIRRRMKLALGGPEERKREGIKASGKAHGTEDLPLFADGG